MKECWDTRQEKEIIANSADWYPHSPNVVPFTKDELTQMNILKIDWKQYRPGGKPEISVEAMKEKLKKLREEKKQTDDHQ